MIKHREETTFLFFKGVQNMRKETERDHFKTGDKRIMSFLSQRKELIRKKMD